MNGSSSKAAAVALFSGSGSKHLYKEMLLVNKVRCTVQNRYSAKFNDIFLERKLYNIACMPENELLRLFGELLRDLRVHLVVTNL